MKKFLDINGVKVILDIVNEKLQEIEIPSLEQYVKIEDLDDYISDDLQDIENKIPSLWKGTKQEYEEILIKDPNTLYLIKEEV